MGLFQPALAAQHSAAQHMRQDALALLGGELVLPALELLQGCVQEGQAGGAATPTQEPCPGGTRCCLLIKPAQQ
jgi:hypothetical protein